MTSVTVIGLGPMGQAHSAALLGAGYRTTIWNRTESKADALRARGAVWASHPEKAVTASDLIIINVGVMQRLMPVRVAEAFSRALNADTIFAKADADQRRDYEERVRHT